MTTSHFLSENAQVDTASVKGFPSSHKIYVQGSRADIQVPMRAIHLDDTPTGLGGEKNLPVVVYDTSGVYTDPNATIDIRQGLEAIRNNWIVEREDTEQLVGLSSYYGRQREKDIALAPLRFGHLRQPRRALAGQNVSQMHYAKRGIITHEMEYIAIRENLKLQEARANGLLNQHAGESFGASIPKEITPEFVRSRSGIRPSDYSCQHQPS
jgi:phosphomethylpyrimidine synthase